MVYFADGGGKKIWVIEIRSGGTKVAAMEIKKERRESSPKERRASATTRTKLSRSRKRNKKSSNSEWPGMVGNQ